MDNFEKQIHSMFGHIWDCNIDHPVFEDTVGDLMEAVIQCYQNLTSAQPEKTEYIPDTKAVRSKRDCVDLAERVSATFYDQEYEEWTQQTVTIADVLDSVCDDYTVLPSAQPDRKKGRWKYETMRHLITGGMRTVRICSECGGGWFRYDLSDGVEDAEPNYCPNCGADMRGEEG